MIRNLLDFFERGGPVLWVILATAILMWLLIFERFLYFRYAHHDTAAKALARWQARTDHSSRFAHWVKARLVSEIRQKSEQNVTLLRAVVALAPLLGLLGTVTGMISVFDLMALTGSSDARAMSAGVSRATIPTMAGMVVSLSGILATLNLDRRVRRSVRSVEDQMGVHDA